MSYLLDLGDVDRFGPNEVREYLGSRRDAAPASFPRNRLSSDLGGGDQRIWQEDGGQQSMWQRRGGDEFNKRFSGKRDDRFMEGPSRQIPKENGMFRGGIRGNYQSADFDVPARSLPMGGILEPDFRDQVENTRLLEERKKAQLLEEQRKQRLIEERRRQRQLEERRKERLAEERERSRVNKRKEQQKQNQQRDRRRQEDRRRRNREMEEAWINQDQRNQEMLLQQLRMEELRKKDLFSFGGGFNRDDRRMMGFKPQDVDKIVNSSDFLEFVQNKRRREEAQTRRFDNRLPDRNPQIWSNSLFSLAQAFQAAQLGQFRPDILQGSSNRDRRFGVQARRGIKRERSPRRRSVDHRKRGPDSFRRRDDRGRQRTKPQQKDKRGPDSSRKEKRQEDRRKERSPVPENLWSCFICTVDTNNEEEHAKHLETAEHEEAAKKNTESYKEKVMKLQIKERTNCEDKQNVKFCLTCLLPYIGQLGAHQKGEEHKEMMNYLTCYCTYCGFQVFSRAEYDLHKVTVDHIRNLRGKLVANGTREDNLDCPEAYDEDASVGEEYVYKCFARYCNLCDWYAVKVSVKSHCKTEEHFNNLKPLVEEKRKEVEAQMQAEYEERKARREKAKLEKEKEKAAQEQKEAEEKELKEQTDEQEDEKQTEEDADEADQNDSEGGEEVDEGEEEVNVESGEENEEGEDEDAGELDEEAEDENADEETEENLLGSEDDNVEEDEEGDDGDQEMDED